jgi:hypothetical protein
MQIRYKILSLRESEFKFNYEHKLKDKDSVSFDFFHREKADFKEKTISVEAGARVITNDNVALAESSVRAVFTLEPFEEVIKQKDDKSFQTSAPELINTFINITLGALRGIFAKDLAGTDLDGCVLPMIPMNVISQSVRKKTKAAKTAAQKE